MVGLAKFDASREGRGETQIGEGTRLGTGEISANKRKGAQEELMGIDIWKKMVVFFL
jgi:hypothetical protein